MLESKNTYALPVTKEDLEATLSDPLTHVGADTYAIDFVVPKGSVVKAAANGKIIFIKTDSNQGGDDAIYEDFKFYNHIVVKHENGEYTEYGHLKFQGTNKNIGDMVNAGDIIGYSGNTGYSEKPHLHFSVFVLTKMNDNFDKLPPNKEYFINDPDFGYTTIKPRFEINGSTDL
jgi:murein DD-endopeptidase MepM/ murein hydrolase activator NlpD